MNSRLARFYESKGILPQQAPIMVNVPDAGQDVIMQVEKKKKQIDIDDLEEDDLIDYIIQHKPSTNKARQALKKYVYE